MDEISRISGSRSDLAAIPPGRIGHVAVSYDKRYMIIWGGYKVRFI